jgi:hypothetical protein
MGAWWPRATSISGITWSGVLSPGSSMSRASGLTRRRPSTPVRSRWLSRKRACFCSGGQNWSRSAHRGRACDLRGSASEPDVRRDLARLVRHSIAHRDELLTLTRAARSAATDDGAAIAHWLYQHWYLVPDVPAEALGSMSLRTNLPAMFRAALPASTRWMTGWVVLDVGRNGACVAGRRGQARELRCGEYANVSRPAVPVMPGDAVVVTGCVDHVDAQTGFWASRSAAGEPVAPLIRLYWAAREEQVGHMLRDLTQTLERLAVRFSLKCPIRSEDFARVDPLVVYLERSAWDMGRDSLIDLAQRSEARLRAATPPLTLKLASGVAFAEDPGEAESFGQSRCRALATGVSALLADPDPPLDRGLSLLGQALRAARIDPNRPWLNAVP